MKKLLVAMCIGVMLTGSLGSRAYASEESAPPIVIDGVYEDWSGKPALEDEKGDGTNSHEDLKGIQYISDDKYLYLYVERYGVEGQYNNQGLWDLWIPIINGNGNGAHNCFFPWDKVDGETWYPQSVSTFKITTGFEEFWDSSSQSMVKKFKVTIKLNGENVEQYMFNDSDGSRFELRLPLELVGLGGDNSEIKFAVASDIGAANENVDWIGKGPIDIVDGPIFGIFTGIVILGAFIWVGMRIKTGNVKK